MSISFCQEKIEIDDDQNEIYKQLKLRQQVVSITKFRTYETQLLNISFYRSWKNQKLATSVAAFSEELLNAYPPDCYNSFSDPQLFNDHPDPETIECTHKRLYRECCGSVSSSSSLYLIEKQYHNTMFLIHTSFLY